MQLLHKSWEKQYPWQKKIQILMTYWLSVLSEGIEEVKR
jgi:hypothetical protein